MSFMQKLRRIAQSESGQSTTEYILILAVVVMIAMKFKDKIGDVIGNATDKIQSNIETTLQDIN